LDTNEPDGMNERWQPDDWASPHEAVAGSSSVLAQPEELGEPWLRHQQMTERAPRESQHRRKLLVKGIAGGVMVVTLVASVILLRPHRARIAELLDGLKNLAVGEALTSDAGQPPEGATTPSKSTLRVRRLRQAKDGLGGENESSVLSAASPNSEASTPARQPNPLQLEVLEMNNQRRFVQPRSVPVVRIRWDDLSTAKSRSTESASPSTSEASTAAGLQEISGGGLEQREMPTYPPLALQNNVQGTVVLRFMVGKDGTVQNIQLLGGSPILASAVMDAVQKWRYSPYYRNGEPVAMETQITVEFIISTK